MNVRSKLPVAGSLTLTVEGVESSPDAIKLESEQTDTKKMSFEDSSKPCQ